MREEYPDGRGYPLHPRESSFLFAGGDYSIAWAYGDGPSPPYAERWKPTEEERLARLGSMLVNAGTFEVDGGRMVAHPRFALAPELVGGEVLPVSQPAPPAREPLTLRHGPSRFTVRCDGRAPER